MKAVQLFRKLPTFQLMRVFVLMWSMSQLQNTPEFGAGPNSSRVRDEVRHQWSLGKVMGQRSQGAVQDSIRKGH